VATDPVVDSVDVRSYTIPTDAPEGDGTLAWDSTTMVLVQASGAGRTGVGWTYAPTACATLVAGKLAGLVEGSPVYDVPGTHL